MGAPLQLVGERFGRLTVVERIVAAPGKIRWRCRCDCGKEITPGTGAIRSGNTRSCGCIKREPNAAQQEKVRTHGLTGTPTYVTWRAMMSRCFSPASKDFARYGAKGITVCERWKKFENFFADMGEKPAGTSIDRIDNLRGYEPGNCRWSTQLEQQRNRSSNFNITYDGKTMCASAWSAHRGYKDKHLIAGRIKYLGWSVERAITTPPRKTRRRANGDQSGQH